ncbi:MAG: AAA family ATPase [Granulosicoccus sp.]
MLLTEAELYLPISEDTLQSVLDENVSWKTALQELEIPEIAALFLLTHLPELSGRKHPPAERLLADIIVSCNEQVENSGMTLFIEYASQQLTRHAIDAGFQLLPSLRIVLLDEETVTKQAYLSPQGVWDYGFQPQYRESLARQRIKTTLDGSQRILSSEQSRVYREFEAQKDEHMHIQGYAGTGKTSLIKSLLDMLGASGRRILLVAASKRQLDALSTDGQKMQHVQQCTFATLADMVIPPDLTSAANRSMRSRSAARATMPDDIIIRQLGVRAIGGYGAQQIIKAIRATVFNFCQSKEASIMEKHIPASYATTFDATLRAVVRQYANDLWNTLLLPPTKNFKPQIRGFHKIKWAALNGWPIPEQYTHIIVDECHDLPKPVLQILACSPQALATLGDDYQNLRGQTYQQASNIRLREMVQSIRSGRELENIINPIIVAHPSRVKTQFQGNTQSKLRVEYYQKATTPTVPALILVTDNWGLFEWVQRLTRQNINPDLMSDHKDLDMFVQDCIELKYRNSRARHGQLFRFNTWDNLATAYQNNAGFRRFNQLLDRGYEQKNWQQTYKQLTKNRHRTHIVSLIENARNLEFDNVMLAPDVFDSANQISKAAFSATIYVAVTRARKRLIAPEKLRQWIEDISVTGMVDRKTARRSRT